MKDMNDQLKTATDTKDKCTDSLNEATGRRNQVTEEQAGKNDEKDEVEKVMNEKKPTTALEPKKGRRKGRKPAIEVVQHHDGTINPVGHALFEEEYEDGMFQMQRKRRGGRGRSRKQSEDDDFSPMRAGRKGKAGDKKSKR